MKRMPYRLGGMQGRLLPKYQERYQAHPVDYWQQEFMLARELGLDCIEFILDENELEKNPLMHDNGIAELKGQIDASGANVLSVCADYFMQAPMHSCDEWQNQKSLGVFMRLLNAAAQLDVSDIVIPCVDSSSILAPDALIRFVEVLQSLKGEAEARNINLSLETDLPPARFANLLAACDSPNITVNYDIGNSAALGDDTNEELAAYG